MNRLTLTVTLVLAAALAAYGQDLRVQYLEGLVEVQRGAAWHQVAAGDAVPAGAVVRLDDGAFAELTGGGGTLRLSRRGTYELGRLASASAQNQSVGIGTFLTQRARAMSAPPATKATAAVGGARAGIGPASPPVKWAGEESAEQLLSDGIEKLASGAYKEAYNLFQEALDGSGPEKARTTFYLGYAAYLGGDVVAALRNLERPRPDAASPYYHDHVLVLAQLLVETFAYADAADLLQGYLRSGGSTGENLQTAQLFFGLSQKGLGNRDRAAESLRAARQLNADSSAGRAAARILETL